MTMTSTSRLVFNARVIGERFRLVRALGEGGMGVVWEGIEERTGTRRALKFIKDEERSPVNARRLVREAEAASAIHHPNIVRIDEVVTDDDGTPVIVMEFLEGESLGQRIERDGILPLGQATAIVKRIVMALRAAHAAGVVHRDLKPDNVFLVEEPSGAVDVRVLDFGVAKQFNLAADTLTVTGTIVGTPLYMSPEQAGGEKGLDARSDAWSIAVILYECLTGTTPATGDNYGQLLTRLIRNQLTPLAELRADLPPDLLAVVSAALVPREQRSADLAPMEATLARYADPQLTTRRTIVQSEPGLPVRAPDSELGETVSVTWRNTAKDPPQRRKGHAATTAFVIAAVVLVAAGGGAVAVRVLARKTPMSKPVSVASQSRPEEAPRDPEAALSGMITPTQPPLATAASASASASVSPVASGGKRPPNIGPRPAAPAASTKHGTPATRLQGGVAGEVPF
jgi:serine/threonine-protein kinase